MGIIQQVRNPHAVPLFYHLWVLPHEATLIILPYRDTLLPLLARFGSRADSRIVVWRTFCTKINCVVVREWYLPDLSTDQDFRKIHHVKLHKYEYLYTI